MKRVSSPVIDDMVEHATDDELFAGGYLQEHLTLRWQSWSSRVITPLRRFWRVEESIRQAISAGTDTTGSGARWKPETTAAHRAGAGMTAKPQYRIRRGPSTDAALLPAVESSAGALFAAVRVMNG